MGGKKKEGDTSAEGWEEETEGEWEEGLREDEGERGKEQMMDIKG